MKKNLLLFAFCLFFIGVTNTIVKAQSTSPIPFQVSAQLACDKSRSSWPINMAMDSSKNKYVLCTQNFNGQGGLEIVLNIVKFDPTATQMLYSISLNIGNFVSSDIAVTSNGTAFVLHGSLITRISPDGQVVDFGWTSSYLSEGKSIFVDSQNNIFVAGQSLNNGAVAKVLPDGSAAYVQSFGGSGFEIANAISIDSNQTLVVTGRTESSDFPILNAFQSSLSGSSDAFLVRLNSNNGAILSSTYLGGGGFDEGQGIVVGSSGNIVVVGETDSANFPVSNAMQASLGGQRDGFVSKFNNHGSTLVYSTYIGGSADDRVVGVALDSSENALFTGITGSPNFPLFRSAKTVLEGNWQAFFTKFNTNGSSFIFSTYQSGGVNNFYNGFDIIDDSFGGLYLSVNSHSFVGSGDSHGIVLRFSPYFIRSSCFMILLKLSNQIL